MGKDEGSSSCIDTEAILKELDCSSRPNIRSTVAFSSDEMREIYDSLDETKNNSNEGTTSSSDTSLITNFSDCRLAPDGKGNTSDDTLQFNKID